jgi:hypothetical protein
MPAMMRQRWARNMLFVLLGEIKLAGAAMLAIVDRHAKAA